MIHKKLQIPSVMFKNVHRLRNLNKSCKLVTNMNSRNLCMRSIEDCSNDVFKDAGYSINRPSSSLDRNASDCNSSDEELQDVSPSSGGSSGRIHSAATPVAGAPSMLKHNNRLLFNWKNEMILFRFPEQQELGEGILQSKL
jgi:hypothetical protein